MSTSDLRCFFHPQSIAVIGASESPEKLGHEILKNLVEGGFPGAIYPINPKTERILGLTCFTNVKEIPDAVDLAVVIIPSRFVPQAIQDCGEKHVKGAIIVTGGFSEAGDEGEALQNEVARIAKEHDVRLIGPNCQGVNNPYHPLCASWPLLTQKGRVAVISQSGTVGAAMMDWFSVEELGVSSFVSLGNRADVSELDLMEYFEEDPNTSVIAIYLEGTKDAERFQKILGRVTKPVVILKAGRTPGGKVAAESHTKSLAGADAIYSSIFQRNDVCRAETIQDFYDFAKGLAYLNPPDGNRILFVTTSGGAAILATDAAEQEGLEVPPLPKELADQLEGIIPPHAIRGNPLDLTGDANAKMFQEVIQRARPHFDTVGIIFGDPVLDASTVVTPHQNELVMFLGGAEVEREEKLKMHHAGIPVFPTPERGIRALSHLIPPSMKGQKAKHTFPAAEGKSQMSLSQCFRFLEGKGFDCIVSRSADSPGKAAHVAHQLGLPVAVKIDSPHILHKSDVGGVKLNILSAQDVRATYDRMLSGIQEKHPEATLDGVVVSAMASPGLEVILGMNRDEQFGPMVMFGLGGITVELFRDVSLRLLPIDRDDALEMIHEIKAAPLLKGYRGQQKIDVEALADALLNLAQIAQDHPDIVEIDLNPAFAYPEGLVVVDARILKA